jgi:hypothetical protein
VSCAIIEHVYLCERSCSFTFRNSREICKRAKSQRDMASHGYTCTTYHVHRRQRHRRRRFASASVGVAHVPVRVRARSAGLEGMDSSSVR